MGQKIIYHKNSESKNFIKLMKMTINTLIFESPIHLIQGKNFIELKITENHKNHSEWHK